MSAFEAVEALPEDVLRLLSPEADSSGLTDLLRYVLGAIREIGTVMVRRLESSICIMSVCDASCNL